ncbi:serine hydrolase [candidate division KSB1 bacterium]|nr:serine hydrolase [candidate division KSB1 bacterium]
MEFFYRRKIPAINFLFIIVFLFSCSQQSQYKYKIPEKTDDGWETASLSEADVDPVKINTLMLDILNEKYKHIHSVLLIKNGKLILEEYFFGHNRSKIHSIQSCTKSITSILIGIAIDQKIISNLNAKIYELLPKYKGTQWIDQKYEITLKHALTMTAGLDWDERTYPYTDSRNNNKDMNQSTDWIEYFLNRKVIGIPGARFNYTSGLTILLGEIIRDASGQFADVFAEKYLFHPLGISDYKWYRNSVYGTIHTGGGLYLRSRDLAKIGYMMLKGGKWKGKQIVSRNWVNESTKEHIKAGWSNYGYQWWCGKTIKRYRILEAFWAAGKGGQYIFVLPEPDLVVVFTAKHKENPGASKRAFNMLTNYILPAVLAPLPRRKAIKVSHMILDTYPGIYKFKEKDKTITITIFREGDSLFARRDNEEEKVELFPETNTHFFGTSKDIGGFFIDFKKDDKGDISHFVLQFARQFNFVKVPFDKIKISNQAYDNEPLIFSAPEYLTLGYGVYG